MGPNASKPKSTPSPGGKDPLGLIAHRENSDRLRQMFSERHFIEHPAKPTHIVCIHRNDATLIVVADESGTVSVWNVPGLTPFHTVPTKGRQVRALVGMGERFIVVYDGEAATVVHVFEAGGAEVRLLRHDFPVWSVNVVTESPYRIVCLCDVENDRSVYWWTLTDLGTFSCVKRPRHRDDDHLNIRQVVHLPPTSVVVIPSSEYHEMYIYHSSEEMPTALVESKIRSAVTTCYVDADHRVMYAGTTKGELKQWLSFERGITSLPTKVKLISEGAAITSLSCLSSIGDGKNRVLIGHKKGFCIMDMETDHVVCKGDVAGTALVACIPDVTIEDTFLSGQLVCTVSVEGLQIWNTLSADFVQQLHAMRSNDIPTLTMSSSASTMSGLNLPASPVGTPIKEVSKKTPAKRGSMSQGGGGGPPRTDPRMNGSPFIPVLDARHIVVTYGGGEEIVCVVNDSMVVAAGSVGPYMVCYADANAMRAEKIQQLISQHS